jgi:hypothetical protein
MPAADIKLGQIAMLAPAILKVVDDSGDMQIRSDAGPVDSGGSLLLFQNAAAHRNCREQPVTDQLVLTRVT